MAEPVLIELTTTLVPVLRRFMDSSAKVLTIAYKKDKIYLLINLTRRKPFCFYERGEWQGLLRLFTTGLKHCEINQATHISMQCQ